VCFCIHKIIIYRVFPELRTYGVHWTEHNINLLFDVLSIVIICTSVVVWCVYYYKHRSNDRPLKRGRGVL